jgi:hypothetical protein
VVEHPESASILRLASELDAAVAGADERVLRARPAADAWSILEVCGHLVDAARIEHSRILRMLDEQNPVLAPYDERAMVRIGRYGETEFETVRAGLAAAWGRLGGLLSALPDDAWPRTGMHPVRGVSTIRARAARLAEHTREHFRQIQAAHSGTAPM